jgi:hypothetical protein
VIVPLNGWWALARVTDAWAEPRAVESHASAYGSRLTVVMDDGRALFDDEAMRLLRDGDEVGSPD